MSVLSTTPDGPINVVALGPPPALRFARLLPLVEQYPPQPDVEFIVCTHRLVLVAMQQRGWLERLRAVGVQVIVDTCVVVTPIVRSRGGVLMTNSGKFAHYSPGNIGFAGCLRQSGGACGRRQWGSVSRRRFGQGKGGIQYPVGRYSAGSELVISPDDRMRHSSSSPIQAEGRALVLDAPLSLWGGLEPGPATSSSTSSVTNGAKT